MSAELKQVNKLKKTSRRNANSNDTTFIERLIKISRVTKVTKGGKKLSFRAVVVIGDENGQVGVGGSPGEGVTIKAGATIIKPEKVNQSGFYQMNIDKNNQTNSGSDMVVVGDFSNDTNQNEYTLKNLVANNILTVSADSSGELWLVVGTDSGFEATTTLYYNLIKVKLEKQ